MNLVREKVIEQADCKGYKEFAEYKDLIAFTLGAEYFTYDYETDETLEADFDEVIVVVEKNWLFDLMYDSGIFNPREFLQLEYIFDDSYEWFCEAVYENKIVMIDFN